LVFYNFNIKNISDVLENLKVSLEANPGAIASTDDMSKLDFGIEITQTSFFAVFGITNKITHGLVEIIYQVKFIEKGIK
jgi:hypothetical protein